jgi:hypothetical protein
VADHQPALVDGQRTRLVEDRVRDGDLADVVQEEAELDLRRVQAREAERPGDRDPIRRHPFGVLPRIGVASLHGVGESSHGRHVGARQLLGSGPLSLEGVAKIGGITLQLTRVIGRLPFTLVQFSAQAIDLQLELSFGPELHRSPDPVAVDLRARRPAGLQRLHAPHYLHPEVGDPRRFRKLRTGE